MKTHVVIPARFNSCRFPGKPLVRINGRTMIEHVHRRAIEIPYVDSVTIATDDKLIEEKCQAFGANVAMTSEHHTTGTDRVAEVARSFAPDDIVLNLQGDLPFVDVSVCAAIIRAVSGADIATPVQGSRELKGGYWDTNVVKAAFDLKFRALFFTRSPIPRLAEQLPDGPLWWRHIGLYAYRVKTLLELTTLPPSALERCEKLEQMRALENGYHIKVVPVVNDCGPDINCPEDLEGLEG